MSDRINFKKNRKRIYTQNNQELQRFDPYEMDVNTYERIKYYIDLRGLKDNSAIEHFVNHLIPGKNNLYNSFILFKKNYNFEKRLERKQLLIDQLNQKIDDMEEIKNFSLSLKKKRKPVEDKNPYKIEFEFFDSAIDKIEILIYLGASPTRICTELYKDCRSINQIIFHRWAESTKHIDRIIFASRKSGENYIHLGKDFLLDWLDPNKHPELDMQHVGIVREVALYYSRMAEFMDRKKWGRKLEITDERPQQKFLSGKDLTEFLSGIGKAAERINSGGEELEVDEREEEESGFIDFEEM